MGRADAVQSTLCVLVVLLSPLSSAAEERFIDGFAASIQSLLDEHFKSGNSGMVIGLVDESGSRVFSGGRMDNGADRQIDGDTIFELGSVTKVFTALVLLDAVRRGEVKLDDPISKHLPTQVSVRSVARKEITLANLAAQDSGLPWHPDNLSRAKAVKDLSLDEMRIAAEAYGVEDLYAFLSGHTLTAEPGVAFQYSNVGMSLLGHAISLKTGMEYESLVVERICRPLKMDSTFITVSSEKKARLARGHWNDGTPSEPLRFQVQAPAGSLHSTANDLLRFLAANLALAKSELTPSMAEMQLIRHTDSPRFGKTAMPWFDEGVYNPPDSELLGHGGGGFGNLAFVAFDKKKRRGVVVLTNQMKVTPNGIGWTILQGLPLTQENISIGVREVVGLGFALDVDEKSRLPRLITVYRKSPATENGLSVGMVIRSINGTSAEGKSLKECLTMMGGPAGTKVRLEVSSPTEATVRVVELTRRKFLTATERSGQ